jgi:hypothetical protein
MSYVPPHLRNKQQSTETTMQEPVKKERRPPRRTYEKSQWEIQKEQAEREAEEKRKRALDNTDDNFPSLGRAVTSTTWNSHRTFSQLASDWEKNDDERKKREEQEKEFGQRAVAAPSPTFVLPMFRPTRRFSEPEQYRSDEEKPAPKEDDGWTVVDNTKYRKPKTKRESDDEGVNEQKKEEDSVWAGPEEHETCWDDHRY